MGWHGVCGFGPAQGLAKTRSGLKLPPWLQKKKKTQARTPTPPPPASNFQFANCSSKLLYSCSFSLLSLLPVLPPWPASGSTVCGGTVSRVAHTDGLALGVCLVLAPLHLFACVLPGLGQVFTFLSSVLVRAGLASTNLRQLARPLAGLSVGREGAWPALASEAHRHILIYRGILPWNYKCKDLSSYLAFFLKGHCPHRGLLRKFIWIVANCMWFVFFFMGGNNCVPIQRNQRSLIGCEKLTWRRLQGDVLA